MPWETVLGVNQTLCKAQNTTHQSKIATCEAARQLWEKSIPLSMSLPDVLDICRQCHDLSPFVFNNGNTFAAIGKSLVEEWVNSLPSVEAQILRTTVAHYVAGQIRKPELLQVLRHIETRWIAAEAPERREPSLEKPQAAPSAS